MVKAIIFDCFGVLVTEGWLPFADRYFKSGSESRRRATDMMAAVNRGVVDYQEFITEIASLAGVSHDAAHQSIMRNVPDEPLLAYIKDELRPWYKTGLLSNTGRNRLGQLLTPEQLALFDELVLSYETGYLKPDPRAYEVVASRLGVETEECVFIDDQEKRCDGARAVGMQAVQYIDFVQLERDLGRALAAN